MRTSQNSATHPRSRRADRGRRMWWQRQHRQHRQHQLGGAEQRRVRTAGTAGPRRVRHELPAARHPDLELEEPGAVRRPRQPGRGPDPGRDRRLQRPDAAAGGPGGPRSDSRGTRGLLLEAERRQRCGRVGRQAGPAGSRAGAPAGRARLPEPADRGGPEVPGRRDRPRRQLDRLDDGLSSPDSTVGDDLEAPPDPVRGSLLLSASRSWRRYPSPRSPVPAMPRCRAGPRPGPTYAQDPAGALTTWP